ncbi:hypothetical protein JG688_00007630 [Phytophthora aleatoria]|uniref:Protein kinase domain-containing protein n=1 Tax=Phytophthora aleatoria TaxID=2496075 RepID=A0A8J5IV89_9STRA|nr:hypothetical protein JG688_00007630 [Phytophthora aleatoria]
MDSVMLRVWLLLGAVALGYAAIFVLLSLLYTIYFTLVLALEPGLGDSGLVKTEAYYTDYMAPELIEGKAGTAVYGEAADVYSLAITLWDIANPLVPKYPEATRNAWHQQPERRPSATYILTALETLQQEISAQTALGLATALERSEASMVNGQVLMQRMLEVGYVDSASEAYRMGNSLMSAGFLHHSNHHESFRKTSELFYFDSDVLDLQASSSSDRFPDCDALLLATCCKEAKLDDCVSSS